MVLYSMEKYQHSIVLVAICLLCHDTILMVNSFNLTRIGETIGQLADQWANIGKVVDQVLPCQFTCPHGQKLVRRDGARPMPNGCGTDKFPVDISFIPGATSCCDRHDICYSSCGVKKRKCDDEFFNCLSKICDINYKHEKEAPMKSHCKQFSQIIHSTTLSLGCAPFIEAQKQACHCIAINRNQDEL
ncbi:Group XIIA secretory phospholipase A2 [Trichoplax sp. H2]|uniref:Phospholipase A2 domain-containing protein n=1 Tax=Trichoplax adhaerens TaxID=10228 RepID=B3RKT8_TRIAD|nr:hypothetical protein TRIADDRAFT_51761 [Trichoplax adhaerens]EDV28641.1 hypothetical protein TRIADDRAFT_51761 [Trichoplax adhaerens]RDD44626.1 Group XIIA secretory phospholipase A2 [Trichoplax sp. H2]|eukprot:XP_002107843.1 hypothetical protein TRIADDRAFT_51761 [Trichoplax adhaerens]